MFQKIADNLVGPASVSAKINRFYALYKATLVFSLMMTPYMLINLIFKPHLVTMGLYLLIGVWLYPNVLALLRVYTAVYAGDGQQSLKAYWRLYRRQLRQSLKAGLQIGAVANLVIGVYLYEVALILSQKQLAFMIVPFLVIGALATSALLHLLMLTAQAPQQPLRARLKLAVFIGWKYLPRSVIVALLFVAWLSFANQAAFLNVMIVSTVIWWLLYRNLAASVKKLTR